MSFRRTLDRRQCDGALNTAPFNDCVNRIHEQLGQYFNISRWSPNREFLDGSGSPAAGKYLCKLADEILLPNLVVVKPFQAR